MKQNTDQIGGLARQSRAKPYPHQNLEKKVAKLEEQLGIYFTHKDLLVNALTHSSFAKSKPGQKTIKDNERLEFFGDAVLKLIASEYLYLKFPKMDEGGLTKIRAQIVADRMLAKLAKNLGLGDHILFSYGEKSSGGKTRLSNLANAMEALLGAIFIDKGLEVVRSFFLGLLKNYEKELHLISETHDYKTIIQEKMQKQKFPLPEYIVLKEKGPEHNKIFYVEVIINKGKNEIKAKGSGNTKKDAEQKAAKEALNILKK